MQAETRLLAPEPEELAYAAMMLAQGRLVAMPTETVYGLAADARNPLAVAAIYAAKGRPSFNPLIVHAPDLATAETIGIFGDPARRLAEAFWPGALTLVVPLRADSGIASLVTAGLDTVAIRVPAHQAAQDLLHAFGGVVAAPSANRSGRISPTTAAHVMAGLDGKLAAVIDAGPCPVGVESTIIGWQGGLPALLRPGGIPAEAIAEALGQRLTMPAANADPEKPAAPGMLTSHYAPGAPVRLNARAAGPDEFLIGFGPVSGEITLSPSGDLVEAAANLFDALHRADATGRPIAVAPVPDHGMGRAINDRLRRAAAPR
ncbi:MAG TPA: L-threonylcarbamoyladenylate synthase [Paracoccus sp. (in: a-proteobacteria)]|uniref:L-threonylcarbamoyladenylate synthase n=1 Tax=uncultured Paracoccus sp. TaxID=189685 RepID=UPI002610D360|nr:L-threonylcarbamoyladenylate synthase [uncultured Paracoccus sp.]HMQ40810.1 L-threonylcarbamoyladenylate synthase [Paracoccus sp. (in: a-proteobacteria)]HMR35505.1 L-threonylcarbamoyladenylate synthase [Paracoccus sp. (in: a-proteobacteria)]